MAASMFLLVIMAMAMAGASDAAWCVCRSDVSTAAQQKTLDYACGAGADCAPILANGVCFNPNTVLAHCSYAANSFYQMKGQSPDACDFSASATVTSTDPSGNGCTYAASSSAAGSSSFPASTGGATTSSNSSSTTTTTPNGFTPATGTTGGTGGVLGLVPGGTNSFNDGSGGGLLPGEGIIHSLLLLILLASLALFEL